MSELIACAAVFFGPVIIGYGAYAVVALARRHVKSNIEAMPGLSDEADFDHPGD